MAEEQGLSAANLALIEREFSCKLSVVTPEQKRSLKIRDAALNRLLNAARSEGLPALVGEGVREEVARLLLRARLNAANAAGPSQQPSGALRGVMGDVEAALALLSASPVQGWRPIESLPPAPTDETWRILAYCPGQSRAVAELWRRQEYEGGPWAWSTPCWAGRGLVVFVEAISMWQPIPAPPVTAEDPR